MNQLTIPLHVTKDYDSFKYMSGNRPIDQNHVNTLKRKIEQDGNLTNEFPINVNEDHEVVDGQHRIAALKELNFPVYYTVTEGAGLSTVRQINVGRRNWTWKDYAASFAADGNPHYKDLLDFHEAFNFGNHITVSYCGGGSKVEVHEYQSGGFKVLDRGQTFKLLSQLQDIREALPIHLASSLAAALYVIMTHPDYDHKRMVEKLTKHGSHLHEWRRKQDFLRSLEDIYNLNFPETSRVRFF